MPSTSESEPPSRRTRSAKQKSVACRPCHARKVRCSGGKPCTNCSRPSECVYPARDRQVKVRQSYIDRLLEENEELQSRQQSSTPDLSASSLSVRPPQDGRGENEKETSESAHNPILEERPWFSRIKLSDTPIWIGEASDAAFATRFRQFVSPPTSSTVIHIPRTSYATDEMLLSLSESPPQWPFVPQARFLAEVALRSLCRCYHVVRRSDVFRLIDNMGSAEIHPANNAVTACKMWAIFAIGQLYSTKSVTQNATFPGLAYFAKASSMLQVISERPHLDVVETMLLLSLYSLELNRRHSAYTLAGSAIRVATVMGLHVNADSHIQDPEVREHRNRVWWTSYTFDRMWSSKIGLPNAVPDEDILVDFPSPVAGDAAEDFVDHEYLIAGVKLARLSGDIITSIYGRRKQRGLFSHRVQNALKELRRWTEDLPRHLQVNTDQPAKTVGRPVSLHLLFNQSVILATRPILLHVLRVHLDSSTSSSTDGEIPESARAIAEACIRCARHSCTLLTECWISGAFHALDFFYTQYLFSATTVLGMSSLLGQKDSQSDYDGLEVGAQFLVQLRDNGNFAAKEYCSHMDGIRSMMQTLRTTNTTGTASSNIGTAQANGDYLPLFDFGATSTAESALGEESLQDFLADQNLDLQYFYNTPLYDGVSHQLDWLAES